MFQFSIDALIPITLNCEIERLEMFQKLGLVRLKSMTFF